MIEYGYVSVLFSKRDVRCFRRVVKQICKQDNFYYSDVVDYIKGDVSLDLHLTLFYGLVDQKIDKFKLNEHIKKIDLKSIKLGNIFLKSGYKNLYQILCIEVLDDNGGLKCLSDSFEVFDHEKSVQLEFKPHLTIAYVRPNFNLEYSPVLPKELKVSKIVYFNE